ncbi:MAG: hypothetical protein WC373_12545, partial [Smithella sp.]
MSKNYYCTSITGGTGGLKSIDGAILSDGDSALVGGDGYGNFYDLDADSGATADGYRVVSPTANAGDKRWILRERDYSYDALYDYGAGASYTNATITTALTAIGTTNEATLVLRPGTWVFSTNIDWSAYTNVTLKIAPGAVISHGAYTFTWGGKVDVLPGQYWLNGTGAVTWSKDVSEVYPQWWGAVGDYDITTDTGTDCLAAFQSAATSVAFTGAPIVLLPGGY